MSRVTSEKPLRLPWASLRAVITTSAQKPRAVLTYAQTLFVKAPLSRRDAKLLLRVTSLYVFFGVEDGEVLADDLPGLIALDDPVRCIRQESS
jgi:hypothetical protein